MIEFFEIEKRLKRPEFTAEQTAKLGQSIKIEQIDVKPDGVIYCSSNTVRDILNEAFGFGQWAVYKNDPYETDNCILVKGELWVKECYIGTAIGEHTGNGYMSYGSKIESASSDLITKLGKYLGIASELWDRDFVNRFKEQHCRNIEVLNQSKGSNQRIWVKNGSKVAYPYKEIKQDSKKEEPKKKPEQKVELIEKISHLYDSYPKEAKFAERIREIKRNSKPEWKTDLLLFIDGKKPDDAKKQETWQAVRKEVEDWK
ncbi:MAG TPA: hypothetical protein PKK94_13060 [Leptospiraceae bacterium]|nr:hypothetical protein [Leptospiraceae bacterium]HNO23908.1 hypothetical protein [Leptospiraceae bacterium]